jgi:hypothetical protein
MKVVDRDARRRCMHGMHQLGTRLIGYELGSYELETARKRQFVALRDGGPRTESFRPGL